MWKTMILNQQHSPLVCVAQNNNKKSALTKSMWFQQSLLILWMLVIVMVHSTARMASKTWDYAPLLPLGIQTVASTKGRSKGLFTRSQVPYVRVPFPGFDNFLPVLSLIP